MTLCFDEANAYAEGDEDVHNVPMPPELMKWLEAFVIAHYVPEKRKKRKRREWSEPHLKPVAGADTEVTRGLRTSPSSLAGRAASCRVRAGRRATKKVSRKMLRRWLRNR